MTKRHFKSEYKFPTMEEVEQASVEQLAWWYRFLLADSKEQRKILQAISKRFQALGGMTKELSRRIGYGGV